MHFFNFVVCLYTLSYIPFHNILEGSTYIYPPKFGQSGRSRQTVGIWYSSWLKLITHIKNNLQLGQSKRQQLYRSVKSVRLLATSLS